MRPLTAAARLVLLGGVAIFALMPTVTNAEDGPATAPPDKSGYTVFNPTPTALLRSLCADRPSKSSSPCTVDAGHIQIESDLFNATFDRTGGVNTNTYLYTNPTLKLGLTNTSDIEFSIAPQERVSTLDRMTGARTDLTGVGDLFVRLKLNLAGDDGGNFGLAVSPFIKIPTARVGIGNGATEGGVSAPISISLPAKWSLSIVPEVDLLENASSHGQHANVSGVASLNRPVIDSLTATAELWADYNFDPAGTIKQYSFDLALAWIPPKRQTFQLDGGLNFGLNGVTPGVQAYFGVTQRF